ncbi:universal stress protein [Acidobacteria bacterium AB60]|nr:universal stress protein [Acidobacteria bacterium AB60]
MPYDQTSVVPSRILVPIDFSASSHQALDAATELAEKFGAHVTLLHVIPEYANAVLPDSIGPEILVEAERAAANERFAVSKGKLEEKKIACTVSVEVGGDVASTILEAVEREGADLLVFTTHGLSGWYPQVFGSIAEKLVKLALCPVLLLRTPKPESSAKVPFGRMMEWW